MLQTGFYDSIDKEWDGLRWTWKCWLQLKPSGKSDKIRNKRKRNKNSVLYISVNRIEMHPINDLFAGVTEILNTHPPQIRTWSIKYIIISK